MAVVIGFASQNALSNIISGIFILIFKPVKVSDIIEFKDGLRGTVEEITLRHILIKDFDHLDIAKMYIENGATCLSVLTEEKHFLGKLDYIKNIKDKLNMMISLLHFSFHTFHPLTLSLP